MSKYVETINEFLKAQDALEFQLGDTYDIKTSILLVVIIFLGTQSAGFFQQSPRISIGLLLMQIISVSLLIISGVCAVIELWPRTYKARLAPDEYVGHMNRLMEWGKSENMSDDAVLIEATGEEVDSFKARFKVNSSINQKKAKLMTWSYYCMIVSLMLNLLTVVAVGLDRL